MLLIPSLVRLFSVPFYSKDSRGSYSHHLIVLSEFWHWPWRYWHLNSCVVHTVEEDTYIAHIITFLSIGDNKFLYTCFSRFPTTGMFFFLVQAEYQKLQVGLLACTVGKYNVFVNWASDFKKSTISTHPNAPEWVLISIPGLGFPTYARLCFYLLNIGDSVPCEIHETCLRAVFRKLVCICLGVGCSCYSDFLLTGNWLWLVGGHGKL